MMSYFIIYVASVEVCIMYADVNLLVSTSDE